MGSSLVRFQTSPDADAKPEFDLDRRASKHPAMRKYLQAEGFRIGRARNFVHFTGVPTWEIEIVHVGTNSKRRVVISDDFMMHPGWKWDE